MRGDMEYEGPRAARLAEARRLPEESGWHECAVKKIRQIERLRSLVGPPFEENPNTEAVIDAAEQALADFRAGRDPTKGEQE